MSHVEYKENTTTEADRNISPGLVVYKHLNRILYSVSKRYQIRTISNKFRLIGLFWSTNMEILPKMFITARPGLGPTKNVSVVNMNQIWKSILPCNNIVQCWFKLKRRPQSVVGVQRLKRYKDRMVVGLTTTCAISAYHH